MKLEINFLNISIALVLLIGFAATGYGFHVYKVKKQQGKYLKDAKSLLDSLLNKGIDFINNRKSLSDHILELGELLGASGKTWMDLYLAYDEDEGRYVLDRIYLPEDARLIILKDIRYVFRQERQLYINQTITTINSHILNQIKELDGFYKTLQHWLGESDFNTSGLLFNEKSLSWEIMKAYKVEVFKKAAKLYADSLLQRVNEVSGTEVDQLGKYIAEAGGLPNTEIKEGDFRNITESARRRHLDTAKIQG